VPAKFKGFFPLLGALIFSLAALLPAQSVSAAAIDKLHRFLESTRTVRADFSQIVVAKNGRKPQQSNGVMLLARPGKFRWQIEKPYSQLLLGDGEKVWIYDPDLRQVTVKKVGAALGGSPAALLAGDSSLDKNSLDKNFTLSEAGEREGIEWLEAIPKSTDSGFEKIRLGFVGADLKSMELFDNFGQTTTLLFFRFERNPTLAPALFRFVPPAGADVIGD
jgi:outer membrane lipoprotein carrier protein